MVGRMTFLSFGDSNSSSDERLIKIKSQRSRHLLIKIQRTKINLCTRDMEACEDTSHNILNAQGSQHPIRNKNIITDYRLKRVLV